MALVSCEECGAEISDKASACPKCGSPTSSGIGARSKKGIVTTQQTSKVFKVGQIIGFLLILSGVISCISAQNSGGDPGSSALFFVLGFIVFMGSRLGAWWRNG